MTKRITSIILALACMMMSYTTAQAQRTHDFTVCALNVDGLPQKVAGITVNGDGPGSDGTKLISQYLAGKGYDIMGFSEDFNYHGSLMTALEANYNCGTNRASLSVGSIFSGGIPFDTDGLNLAWKNTMTATNESWTRWSTTTSTDGNQLIKKGFRHYEVALEEGMTIDVYVLHMDAGSSDSGAKESRNAQWVQLAAAINANPYARPKIILGDTNSRWTREDIKTNFYGAIDKFSVHDAWVEFALGGNYEGATQDPSGYGWGYVDQSDPTDYSKYEVVDKVIWLNPKGANTPQLTAHSFKLEQDYTYGTVDESSDSEKALGDHKPLVVSFTYTQPEYKFAELTSRWIWKGQEKINSTLVYLFNVGQGLYEEQRKGFLNKDGYLKATPDEAIQWYLWGDLSDSDENTSISNGNFHLVMKGSGSNDAYVEEKSSGASQFKIEGGNPTTDAYKFSRKFYNASTVSYRTRFFNADSPDNKYTPAESKTEWNDWYIIHNDQKAVYDRYVAAWEKGSTYLAELPLPADQVDEMVALLGQTTHWQEGTTEKLEALNAKIETWFTDYTGSMQNPSFELGTKLGTNYVLGWEVTSDATEAFASAVVDGSEGAAIRKMDGMDGSYLYNTWGGSPANGFYCRQTVNLPEGLYRLSAVFTSDPTGNNLDLLFGDQKLTVTLPARPSSLKAEKWFYHEGGDVVVGAWSANWFEADDFRLTRYDYFFDLTVTPQTVDGENAGGYATVAIAYNTTVPAGLALYGVTEEKVDKDGNPVLHLNYYQPSVLGAEEGVIVHADIDDAKEYRFFRTDEAASELTGNLLLGTSKRIEVTDKAYGKTYYMLANKSKGIGFYRVNNSVAIKANKAYYLTDVVYEVYRFSFYDDITDGIAATETATEQQPTATYTLSGVRTQGLQRGVNIVRTADGRVRKVLVK